MNKVLHAATPRQQSAKLFVFFCGRRPSKANLPKSLVSADRLLFTAPRKMNVLHENASLIAVL
jgi:hypothetical protein